MNITTQIPATDTPLPIKSSWLVKKASRVGAVLKNYSPELLLGAGILGGVATVYFAVQASKHTEDLEEPISELQYVRSEEIPEESQERIEYIRTLTRAYGKVALTTMKIYGPATATGIFSIYSLLSSHGVMRSRNASLLAAYKLVEQAFSSYRKRVVADQGEEADNRYRYGYDVVTSKKKIKGTDGKKSKTITTETPFLPEGYQPEMYDRIFGEGNPEWVADAESNLLFLQAQEAHANNILQLKGIYLLNDLYDLLRIPRTAAGAVVGWRITEDGDPTAGDGYIDLGLTAEYNHDNSWLISPNVDGVVFEHLG